jgi:hypothetical protein
MMNLLSSPPHSDDYIVHRSELVYRPIEPIAVTSDMTDATTKSFMSFLNTVEKLEQLDEVEKVWTNVVDEVWSLLNEE